jgi:hypothetical protein
MFGPSHCLGLVQRISCRHLFGEVSRVHRESPRATTRQTADGVGADATSENNRLAARLASLVCPTYFGPAVTPLADYASGCAVQGLALRVTRRHCRSNDALANCSFCHARVVHSVGQERRATATGTFSDIAPRTRRSTINNHRSARKGGSSMRVPKLSANEVGRDDLGAYYRVTME